MLCAFSGWNDAGDAASAALTFIGESLGAERFARLDGSTAVAQLDGEVRRARARQQAVLARAREDALDLLAGAQGGDAHRVAEVARRIGP